MSRRGRAGMATGATRRCNRSSRGWRVAGIPESAGQGCADRKAMPAAKRR